MVHECDGYVLKDKGIKETYLYKDNTSACPMQEAAYQWLVFARGAAWRPQATIR